MLCPYFFMAQLRRSLGLVDGLAMVVGIMVGSGIFRTPGLVAAYLGRPSLTFVAWILGGVVALLDAPPRGRREIRVRARGVRPAGGLRRGVGRSARHLSRRNRGDRGRGGRVR